jgi:hypothetical protein
MDAADLELFERSVRAATERHSGGELDAALDDLGWADALASDARAAVSVLFENQGRSGATSSALSTLLAGNLGLDAGDHAVVLPRLGSTVPPGVAAGDRVRVEGLAIGAVGERALLVAADGEATVAFDVDTAALTFRKVNGIDPSLSVREVTGDVAPPEWSTVQWAPAVAIAQLAVAHELVGASRRMLELARTHALDRVQFGQPIASFQAVRHRLAEALVAIETADAALDAAWLDGSPTFAAMAKATAGRGARTAARHAQQVLAGVGFTTEHDLHLFVRRVLVLEQLLGATTSLSRALGEDVLATRRLPAVVPL